MRRVTKTICLELLNRRQFSTGALRAKSFAKWYQSLWSKDSTPTPPYHHVTQVGDPVLRQVATEVPEDCIQMKEIQLITEHMVKVLRKYNCVGLAAPQIGISLRIIVMEFREELKKNFTPTVYEARKMSPLPLTILINPQLKVTDYEKYKHPEGCMSVRGYAADVERYSGVSLSGFDGKGAKTELQLTGWNARIAQHEVDHLDGKIYIDHMDRKTFNCTCWEAVNRNAGRIEIPFYK